jgi:hypothetical protein
MYKNHETWIVCLCYNVFSVEFVVDCRKFLDSNALGLTVAALSSYDPQMRAAAYYVLAAYYSHLEGARFREQSQVSRGLETCGDEGAAWGRGPSPWAGEFTTEYGEVMSEGALLRHSPSYREAALQPQGPRSTGKAFPEQCFLVAGQNGFLLLIVSLVKEAVTHCLTPPGTHTPWWWKGGAVVSGRGVRLLLAHGAGLLLKEKAEKISNRKVHSVFAAVASSLSPGWKEQALPAKPGQNGPLLKMLLSLCSGSVPARCCPQWD